MTGPQFRRVDQALSANVGDDIVALNVASGHCFGMTEVSAAVWQLLEQPIALDSICARLCSDYDVEPERCKIEIAGLIEQMRSEGLVEEVA